jgi:nitrate/nitrite-specific signal transduction histidine kinase
MLKQHFLLTSNERNSMKRRRFIPLIISGSAALLASPSALPQVIDVNDAINKAGRQRMLSQRMAKSYLALGQKVQSENADKVLKLSMALFDRQLVELKAFAPTAEVKATYAALEASWNEYKTALVASAPGKAGAELVIALSGKVLGLANQGTVQLEGVSGKAVGKLVNVAGRQRMLSQRMAAFYLSASWGVQAALATSEIAKDEFAKAHILLKTAPEATSAIKSELQLVESQFTFFEIALNGLKPGTADAVSQGNIFTTSERILQVMDGVTGMFSKLA